MEFTEYRVEVSAVLLLTYRQSQNSVHNLRCPRKKWALMNRIFIREGADDRTLGQIYLVVVQLVLLYRSET